MAKRADHRGERDVPAVARKAWRSPPVRQVLAAAALAASGAQAAAEVPDELHGTWSTDPDRCEQIDGEVDLLTVDGSGLDFYEIACDLGPREPSSGDYRFPARCRKGGGPVTTGVVVIRRSAPDVLELSLEGFFWSGEQNETFRKCVTERRDGEP